MSEAKRIKYVSFRLTNEEYTQIEKAAVASGDEPNNWCRMIRAVNVFENDPEMSRVRRELLLD